MSLIYQSSKINFENNKNKIFFDSLNISFTGEKCLSLLKKASDFLEEKNIKRIAIISKNCICWPIWYIASDKFCNNVFVISPDLENNIIKKILAENDIQLTIKNPDLLLKDSFIDIDVKPIFNEELNNSRKDILFTSGTTNMPKGVVISEESFCHVARILIKKLNMSSNDNELLSMPFYHSFGLTRLRCVLLSHSQAFIADGLKNFPTVYKISKDKRLTGLSLVPAGISIIKSLLRKKVKEFSSNIKYFEIGSSSIDFELRVWLKENFESSKIIHHYGMTEASRSFLRERGVKDNFDIADEWVGEPIDGCSFQIDFNDSDELNTGELMIKGLNLFDTYIDKKLNNNKFMDGWFKTGDICKIENKKIFLIGRNDNQFNIGGFKVQAELIEKIVEELPEVKNSLCFNNKNDLINEKINCIIELKNNDDIQIFKSKIKQKFKDLPTYYMPEKFLFKKVNLTSNGKKIRT